MTTKTDEPGDLFSNAFHPHIYIRISQTGSHNINLCISFYNNTVKVLQDVI